MLPPSPRFLRCWRATEFGRCPSCSRQLSRTASAASGHSKFATIKHDKAVGDKKKSQARSLASSDIVRASKFGGQDIAHNTALFNAVNVAKRAGLTKSAIETAIARGQGRSASGAALESLTIEAVIPPVALVVDCQTDNKAQTLTDVRLLVKKAGGTHAPTAYLFEQRGRIRFAAKEGASLDEVLEAALEAGAIDVFEDDGTMVVDTDVVSTAHAAKQISDVAGLELESTETIWWPIEDTRVGGLSKQTLEDLQSLQDKIIECPGVQAVYTNIEQEPQ